ncbi:sterol desaturase family protein [Hydrogenophaga sp. 5NK40-0174]|uniref:sterol desaturase family protein n=1 Tax=Hydrogenophaga sp. 5NK40-0174 TaxID=3127649 RepID=UPI0031056A40
MSDLFDAATVQSAVADYLSLIVPLAFVAMWWWERRRPARTYADMPQWVRWGWGFFVLTAVVGSIVPLTIAAAGWTEWRLWDGRFLGCWGLLPGLLLTSLLHYGWHRLEHASDLAWRFGHQLHHSPTRVDIPGAFYAHPNEVIVKTLLGITANVWLLGLSPAIAATVTTALTLISLFQHWNIRTPRWLGWFIPRPEMHAFHHEANVHARNYSDLPFWDWLFGTYYNPPSFEGQVGFEGARATRVKDMLLMRDVHREVG